MSFEACVSVTTRIFIQAQNDIWPFAGDRQADLAPGEHEFDTPAIDRTKRLPLNSTGFSLNTWYREPQDSNSKHSSVDKPCICAGWQLPKGLVTHDALTSTPCPTSAADVGAKSFTETARAFLGREKWFCGSLAKAGYPITTGAQTAWPIQQNRVCDSYPVREPEHNYTHAIATISSHNL